MAQSAKTILLVEDEAIIALQETRQLRKAGYEAVHVPSGESAIAYLDTNPGAVDIILMDINLGRGIDGTQAAQAILGRHDIPLLFLSSHTEPDVVAKTEEITNYGYVVKSSVFTVLDASIKMAFKLFDAQRKINRNNMEIAAANEELRVTIEQLEETNRELAVSEDKFSKAFHLNPDSININRLSDGVYINVNEGFTQLMGYGKEEVIGRSSLPGDLDIWVNPEDREALVSGLRERGEVADLEADFRRKDGSFTRGMMSARVIEMGGTMHIISITRDITQRKDTENELKESERRFRTVFANAPAGISLTSLNGQLRVANRAFCEMLGRGMLEVSSADFPSLTYSGDAGLCLEKERLLVEGMAESVRFTKRYVHASGELVWADSSVSLVRDESGQGDYFFTHSLDITDQKKSEALLQRAEDLRRESENRLRTMISASPDGIAVLSMDGAIIFASTQCAAMLGYDEAEIGPGQNFLQFLGASDRERALSSIRDIGGGRKTRSDEYILCRKDGSALSTEVNSELLRGDDGTPSGLVIVIRDICDRKRREDELERSQRSYHDLLNAIGEGFCHTDEQSRFIFANPSADRIFGLDEGGLVGRSFIDFLEDGGRKLLEEKLVERRSGKSDSYVMPILRADGSRRLVRLIASPVFDALGKYIGASTIFTDVTDQEKEGEALRQFAAHRETLMKELQHRVKNSLGIISSLLGLARDGALDERARNVLMDTESRIRSMSSIYELLCNSEDLETINFGEYVEELARSLLAAYCCAEDRIDLAIDATDIQLDTKRSLCLGLILNELLTNCMKHAFPGSSPGVITVALETDQKRMSLRVSDNGIGFSDKGIPQSSTSMGMSLLRMLTQQLQASMSVGEGPGSSISISFALDEDSVVETAKP